MIVQHNITSMNANRQLGIVGNNLSKSTEKLSSGYRINRAADDAAGLAISEKMRAQVRGLNRASDNAQDGISLIQTAEGAMDQKHAILQRTRELMVQASNSGVLDGTQENDFQKIQDEIDNLKNEYNRIDTDTEFNKKKLLDGSYKDQWLQVGANSSQGIKVTIKSTSWDDSLYMTKTDKAEAGATGSASSDTADGVVVVKDADNNPETKYTYNKDVFTVEGSKTYNGKTLTTAEFTAAVTKIKSADADDQKAGLKALGLAENTTIDQTLKDALDAVDEDFAVTKVDGKSISNLIDKVDTMIKNVTTERSKLGAVQNRLEYTVKVDDNTAENMQSAESRIRDTDMADEMTRFSKESILQQAATSMLAQANQANQGVLSLLQ